MHGVKQETGAAFLVLAAAGCVGQSDMMSASDRMGPLEQRVPALDQNQAATQRRSLRGRVRRADCEGRMKAAIWYSGGKILSRKWLSKSLNGLFAQQAFCGGMEVHANGHGDHKGCDLPHAIG